MAEALSAGDILTDAEVFRAAIEVESLGYSCKTLLKATQNIRERREGARQERDVCWVSDAFYAAGHDT